MTHETAATCDTGQWVYYTGSLTELHGFVQFFEICDCARCEDYGPRYRLVAAHANREITCVRPQSFHLTMARAELAALDN